MPSRYSIHVKGINPNFETIQRCPFLGADIGASPSQDLVKRRKSKIHESNITDYTSEEKKSNNSTIQDGHPKQSLLPSGAGAETVVDNQTSLSVTVKKAKKTRKKATTTRKATEQQEECVEVYIAKFTSADTSVVTPTTDGNLVGGHWPAVHGKNNADDEAATENKEAMIIKNVLGSKFITVKCSESNQNKEHEDNQHNHHSSEDCFTVSEPAQEGPERQVQILQDGDASYKQSKNSPATSQPLYGKTVTSSHGGLELKVVAGKDKIFPDLIQQPEKKVKCPGYPEWASQIGSDVTPKGLTDTELKESEQSVDTFLAADSPVCMVPSTSHDLFSEELSLADSEQAENVIKPVEVKYVVDTSFPMGSLDVGLECEVPAGGTESPFSMLSASISPGFKRSKVIPTKRKLSSRGRRIKTPNRLETTSDDETMNPVGPRQTKAKSHYRAKLIVEDSSTQPQDEAMVAVRTATTARKRKVIVEETLSSEPALREESPAAVTNQLADDQRDRLMSVETSDSAVAKTSCAVVKRTSQHRQRGRPMKVSTETPVSEIKTTSVMVETFEPVSTMDSETVLTQNFVSKPVLSKVMTKTKPVSSRRFVSKSVSLEKCELLEKHHSGAILNSTSHQAKSSDPPLVEQSRSRNRSYATAKRKAQALNDESSDAYQTDSMESILARKPEPAQTHKCKVSSLADNAFSKVGSETVGIFERMTQKPFDSMCLSADTSSSTQDDMEAGEDTVVSFKQKPNEAVVMPPPDYISFNDTGDVEISEIILNSIPQFVENGSTQIYLLMKNVTLPSSDKQENLVFAADLTSFPYKFNQLTSFPIKRFSQGMLAGRAPEPRVGKECSASDKLFRKQQAESRLPRNDSAQCSSSFDDSSGIEAQDPLLSMNGDITSGMEQSMLLATSDKIINSSVANWTHVDTSAWLVKHGLKKTFALSFSCMDGPRMLELVHYFNEDLEILIKYLQEMGFLLIDQMKLFQALGTIPTQTCTSSIFSSAETSDVGSADLFAQVSEVKDMAAPAPRKRSRKQKFNRRHSLKISGGTEARPVTVSVPSIKWTYEDVSTWLTSLGLARFTVDFAEFDGQGVSVLVKLFKTNVRAVHRILRHLDFTLFESLTLCARLRILSQSRQEEECLKSPKP